MTKLKTINEIKKEIEDIEKKGLIRIKGDKFWNKHLKLQAQLKTSQDIYDEIENMLLRYKGDSVIEMTLIELRNKLNMEKMKNDK